MFDAHSLDVLLEVEVVGEVETLAILELEVDLLDSLRVLEV